MKKTLVALLLALCMVTSLTAATACCVDSGRAETTGMEKPMTMGQQVYVLLVDEALGV